MSKQHKLKIVVTRKLPSSVELRLMELFDTKLNDDDHIFSREQLIQAVNSAEVLVSTVTDAIDTDIISKAGKQLRLIAQFGAGIDNIDVDTANKFGITVTNTPGVLTDDTADVTLALVLSVPRRLHEGAKVIEKGQFTGWTPTWMMGRRVAGKRLGIIGMGRIGQAVASRSRAFGMQIHYHNRKPVSSKISDQLEATYWNNLDQMLAHVDIISVNCPHTPATFHLLNARRLERCKPEAFIVNTSRGEVIDEAALAKALKSGRIAGAGLDVFEREPLVHEELLGLPNVVLLPHMGSATLEGRIEMGEKVIVNIKTFSDGHKPPDRVIPAIL